MDRIAIVRAEARPATGGNDADLALWAWTRGGSIDVTDEPASLSALDAVGSNGMP